MSGLANRAQRSRCDKGRFVSRGLSSRDTESLVNQRLRQKAYIQRRTKAKRKFISSFAKAFIIQDQGKHHWLPGCLTGGPLFQCMDELIHESYLDSPRSRVKALKFIYFKGDPTKGKERLPRIRAFGADKSKKDADRVAAFLGWRFPCTTDHFEMDSVKKWLKANEDMLKVSLNEAINICFRIFSSYQKKSGKYLYSGYPLTEDRDQAESTQNPVNSNTNVDVNGSVDTNSAATGELRNPPTEDLRDGQTERTSDVPAEGQRQEPILVEPTKAEQVKYVQEIMQVARINVFYRSLKVALAPSCPTRFNIVCTAWTSLFHDGKPSEDWCGLQKEIFEYCRLTALGETNNPAYLPLQQQLCDDFEVFRMVRRSAGLPLYDDDAL